MNIENQKATDSSKPQAQGRSRAQGASKAARILIVDDEPNLLSGLSEYLQMSGYETETAGDGKEALARIGRFKPDLVISDLMMPGLDGIELLESVRATDPAIKFIMITGKGTVDAAVKSIKLGAFNFLEKPLGIPQLLAQVRACLKQERALRVFLCHSSSDKPKVRKLFARLRRDGFDPWLDEKKLKPGQDWQLEIKKAVRNSDVVLACLSNGSVTKAGFVQIEIKTALDVAEEKPEETIFIIPLRLEACSVPDRLLRWQWVDLFKNQGYAKLMATLRSRYNPSSPML